MEERLQKVIARSGVASRRAAEDLIRDGRVTVNGEKVEELGLKVDPEKDHIKVDGKRLRMPEDFVYLLMNKPKGVISSVHDPEGRPVVVDLLRGVKARVYPVGRLDMNSEGAILLTNDGELANRMLSAKFGCPKTYVIKVSGQPDFRHLQRLERGVTIDGVRYGQCKIQRLQSDKNTWLSVVLTEGKNHHLRKVFEWIGHPVSKLKRVALGFLTLDGLEPGQVRPLQTEEVLRLKRGDFVMKTPLNFNAILAEYGVRVRLRSETRKRDFTAPPSGKRRPMDGKRRKETADGTRSQGRASTTDQKDRRKGLHARPGAPRTRPDKGSKPVESSRGPQKGRTTPKQGRKSRGPGKPGDRGGSRP